MGAHPCRQGGEFTSKKVCDLLKDIGNKVDQRVYDLPLYDDYIENVQVKEDAKQYLPEEQKYTK